MRNVLVLTQIPKTVDMREHRFLLRQCLRTGPGIQFLQGAPFLSTLVYCTLVDPHKVYAILDEIFLAGEIEETSKDVVLSRLEALEKLE